MEAPLQLFDVDVWVGTAVGTLKGLRFGYGARGLIKIQCSFAFVPRLVHYLCRCMHEEERMCAVRNASAGTRGRAIATG